MSQQRTTNRNITARYRKEPKKRTTCKRCGAKLTAKPGYGYVCAECGDWPKERFGTENEIT